MSIVLRQYDVRDEFADAFSTLLQQPEFSRLERYRAGLRFVVIEREGDQVKLPPLSQVAYMLTSPEYAVVLEPVPET